MLEMFNLNDLAVIGGIIGVDLVMSGDNAVVIALASQRLSATMKKKAMVFGALAAVMLRVAFTSVAVTLLDMPYLQMIGGVVLVWISYKLMVDKDEEVDCKAASGVLEAVKTIVVADAVMSTDNVLGLAAVAKNSQHEYLFLMIGLLISLPIVVFGATLISRLLDRFSILIYVGSGILLYAAGELIVGETFLTGNWIAMHGKIFVMGLTLGGLGLGYWQNTHTSASMLPVRHDEHSMAHSSVNK